MLQPEPMIPVSGADDSLRTELDELNGRLKVLRSTDFALRAYIVAWGAFVSGSVAAKLTWDWMHSDAKPPVIAVPLAIVGVLLTIDAVRSKMRQKKLAREEERELARQRELRGLLGIDEARFSSQG